MSVKKLRVKNIVLELIVPEKNCNLIYSPINNINAYNEDGNVLWNIGQLLTDYSDKHKLHYFDEMYFDIQTIDDNTIRCVGFNNHCEINLDSKAIIRIINNR